MAVMLYLPASHLDLFIYLFIYLFVFLNVYGAEWGRGQADPHRWDRHPDQPQRVHEGRQERDLRASTRPHPGESRNRMQRGGGLRGVAQCLTIFLRCVCMSLYITSATQSAPVKPRLFTYEAMVQAKAGLKSPPKIEKQAVVIAVEREAPVFSSFWG